MAVVCDDGSFWVSWPDGDREREWVEGSPIPGSVRGMNRGGIIPIQENIRKLNEFRKALHERPFRPPPALPKPKKKKVHTLPKRRR